MMTTNELEEFIVHRRLLENSMEQLSRQEMQRYLLIKVVMQNKSFDNSVKTAGEMRLQQTLCTPRAHTPMTPAAKHTLDGAAHVS